MKLVSQVVALAAMLLVSSLATAQTAVEADDQSVNQLLESVPELSSYFSSDWSMYYARAEEEISKFVDFREGAVGVMARYSKQASEEQLVAFGEKPRSTLTRFYGSALVGYGG